MGKEAKDLVAIFCRARAILFNDVPGADVRDEEGAGMSTAGGVRMKMKGWLSFTGK